MDHIHLPTDGRNDANSQLYPIIVRYFDSSLGNIVSVILSVLACKEGYTGENIFNLVDKEFAKKKSLGKVHRRYL